ncbi:uncharacterized protein LOC115210589, partial [Argonauta hians]
RLLGGDGLVVEIDESLFARRKYNRGRLVKDQWMFGGYCRTTKKGFLIPVPDRNKWGAYNGIESIVGGNYTHKTVNHSEYFVDPGTGVHTNSVESMWGRAKAKIKAM